MNRDEALEFCGRWLPLWTGNRPEEVAEMYDDNAVYRDPNVPDGIVGRGALLAYLRRLLARYRDWEWEAEDVFPVEGGFALRWRARIPVRDRVIQETGLDLVLVRDGRITRNEVYFDRTAVLRAEEQASSGSLSGKPR